MMSRKVFVETYGCQMNVYDTELVKTILTNAGYEWATEETDADVVMLNTCSVRDNANRRVFGRIHEIKRRATAEKPVLVGILGCMATNFRRKLLDDRQLKIDFIAGPDSYKQLPHLISEVCDTGDKQFNITLSEFETYADIYPTRSTGSNAWVAVMRGCNNYCTFCVVPHTRGRERSRDPQGVVDEVKRLVSEGFSQVTLLGQNVNSYRYEDTDFADLMAMVSDVPGVKKIRFTSPHPKDFPLKLLNVMAERPNICKQLHMPLQAGNDRILDKMNRTYTKEEFLSLVDQVRSVIPDAYLSTDVIVGFCSETPEEFEDTMDVMRRVRFDTAFMFKYSERPNTLASVRFKDDVSDEEKTRRITQLVALQRDIAFEKRMDQVGQIQEVVVEKKGSRKDPEAYIGHNDGNILVMFYGEGQYASGDVVKVKISSATPDILRGVVA